MGRGSSDDHLDELLRRSYSRTVAPAESCPGADMLAAFVDGGLDAAERLQLTQHAASCSRCAQMLALAAEPAGTSVAPAPARSRLSRWRWMIPIATAATVAGVWIATRDAVAPVQMPSSTESVEMTAARPAGESASSPEPSSRRAVGAVPVAEAPAAIVPDSPSPTGPSQPVRRRESFRSTDVARDQALENAQPVAAPPPPVPAAPAPPPREVALASPRAPGDLQQTEPVDRQQSPARGDGAGGRGALGGVAGGLVEARVTISPETPVVDVQTARQAVVVQPVMWRSNGDVIQQSVDQGRTWTTAYDAGRRILASSTPTFDAGWFVGVRGLIVRRFGAGWSTIAAPANGDIVGVQATDDRVATITLADGRRFATTDAGATWTQR